MIQKKTVLVLGAGASCHLGFPLGQKLIEDIYRLVHDQSRGVQNTRVLAGAGNLSIDCWLKNSVLLERFLELSEFKKNDGQKYSSKDIEEFAERLYRAQPSSIDFFLEKNPHYSLLGKICIIFCLSRYEDQNSWQYFPSRFPERLVNDFPKFGWYQYLWHRMIEGCETLADLREKNKITVITFNYDRSLEYYLMEAIKCFFNVDESNESDAAEVFNSIKIKHVYGKLGKFYWEINHLEDSSHKTPEDVMMETAPFTPWEISCFFRLMGNIGEYGMARDDFKEGRSVLSQESRKQLVKKFKRVAQEIRTFYEATNGQKNTEYSRFFSEAERLYFLGFGYHDLNIKALGLDTGILSHNVEVSGTAVDMTDKEVEQIKHYVASFSISPREVNIRNKWNGIDGSESSRILSFLRNIAPLE